MCAQTHLPRTIGMTAVSDWHQARIEIASGAALQAGIREGAIPKSGTQMLYQVAWLPTEGDRWNRGIFALGDNGLFQLAFALHSP